MKEVGAYEAKTNLARLLDEVESGERVVITRHGIPVAQLVPMSGAFASSGVTAAVAELKELRKGKRSGGQLKAMIEEGRR